MIFRGPNTHHGRGLPVVSPTLSVLGTLAAGMSAGQALDAPTIAAGLNVHDGIAYPTEGKANTTTLNWTCKMAWDSVSKRTILYSETAGAIGQGGIWSVLLSYDDTTNTWAHIRNPMGAFTGHGYDSNAFDQADRVLYKANYGSGIARWDSANWVALAGIDTPATSLGPVTGGFGGVWGTAWFPTMGSQGALVACDSSLGRIYKRPKDTGVWVQIHANATMVLQTVAHYQPLSDKCVMGGANAGGVLYFVTNDGTVTATSACPQAVQSHASGQMFLPSPVAAESLLLSPTDTTVYALNHSTGAWSSRGAVPALLTSGLFVGVPIPEYGVILFIAHGNAGTNKVVLYKPA